MKFLLIVTVVLLRVAFGTEEDFRRIDVIYSEAPCTAAGGMCTVAADCPDGHLSEQKGLCPKQQSQGIECCYGLSTKETRCNQHGGICMTLTTNFCNPKLVFNGATDCKDNTRCCIVVL